MSNIVRWEPFNELVSLRDAMDRLFEDSIIRPRSWLSFDGDGLPVDVYETKEDIVIKAAVPGVKPEDIDISITGDTLTIKGEYKEEEKVEKEDYYRRERHVGAFSRAIELPLEVNAEKASAEFADGVLTLTLPKSEEVMPKTIEVHAKK